jgi:hypothetical protein
LNASLLSLLTFPLLYFVPADCVRIVIRACHFRSSIPHTFVVRAETKKGQLLFGIAPFSTSLIAEHSGKWPEEIRRIARLSSCFAFVVHKTNGLRGN